MKTHSSLLWIISFILLAMCGTLTLINGETPWPLVWEGVKQRLIGSSSQWNPLLDERLPRLIVLICTGSSLAVSGAVMQSLFYNPLASPSVLGITSGGCLFVILVFLFDLQFFYPFALPIAAFLGCFLTLCFVYTCYRIQGGVQLSHLILTGIAISILLLAIQNFLLYALRDRWQLIQTITEWEAGSTLDRNWQHVHMQLPLTLIGLVICWIYRREMNILALGEEEAKNLGVEITCVRWRLFLSVALLTGGALAAVGVVAFFGLVLPHLVRRLQGPDHLTLVPLCILVGAISFALFDIVLRFFSLHFISIGNLSALIGGLFFLVLLFRTQQQRLVA
jgi:iron complex transport system permease protein